MEATPYIVIQAGFVLVTFFFYGVLMYHIRKAIHQTNWEAGRKRNIFFRMLLSLLLWMMLISFLSLRGTFQNFTSFPPPMIIVLIIPLVTLLPFSFSNTARDILTQLPPSLVIRLQVFRVFVEILLWWLFLNQLLPVQMTFEGRNFDVVAGITAPLIAYFAFGNSRWPKWIPVIWNFLSLGLLINIVTIALLSMPTPFRIFMNEPSNTIVAQFPIIWLPALLVPLAYTLHIFSLRQLLGKFN